MYSLYRAWFGAGTAEESYPRMETLSPPDTLVRVGNEGEHQFVAHRGVLAAHSGYLKALLATATSSTAPSAAGSADPAAPVTSVSVSSVGGEAFAPLLNYMYTGHLEVTLDNIYSVLLATHLLHMPGALEQCRAALSRLRAPPPLAAPPPTPTPTSAPRAGSVLRPVPNRVVAPPLCWPQPTLYPSVPVSLSHLPNLQIPGAISAVPSLIHEARSSVPYSLKEASLSSQPTTNHRVSYTRSRSPSPEIPIPRARKSDTEGRGGEVAESEEQNLATTSGPGTRSPSPSGSSERISVTDTEVPKRRGHSRSNTESATSGMTLNVVYDVACCDGPVRFHRVLNENYAAQGPPPTAPRTRTSCAAEEDLVIGENDENGHPDGATSESSRTGGTYTCSYCKHTFKSQYCYQKHARRHLLPTAESVNGSTGISRQQAGRRREVRLLDLNVQYYPCKICGSKFPSYYFVHKHRKLCHSNVEDPRPGNDSSDAPRCSNSNSEDQ